MNLDKMDLSKLICSICSKKLSDDEEDILRYVDEQQQEKFIDIMRSLPHYEPSKVLLQALEVDFTNESLSKENDIFRDYLEKSLLNEGNVCSVLGTLLSIEDVSTMHLYAQLMQPNVKLKRVNNYSYSFKLSSKSNLNPEEIVAPFIDEVVLIPSASLQASPLPKQAILALLPHKHESLHLTHPLCRFLASVVQVTRTSIQCKFERGALPGGDVLAQRFYVILRSRRTPYRFMYRALQLLALSTQLRRYLFPNKAPLQPASSKVVELPNMPLFNTNIAQNLEQLQAVKHIVVGPSSQAPYIVFGPPGTGKTTTIVEAILQLRLQNPTSRILVTAGSNSACDTIAIKICEYFASNEMMQAHLAKRATESRWVTGDVKLDHQLMRLFSRSVYIKGLSSIQPLLLKHSNCAKNVYEHLRPEILCEYGIIVATLCVVGRLVTTDLGYFFTHIFIDEAGASTEPESLIGIVGVKQHDACHVILSGDHKQLGPVIKSNRAAQLGLSHSLLERLLQSDVYAVDASGNYDHTLQTRLRRNYRSHPEIVGLYNKLYYNGELIAQAPPSEVNLAAKWHMLPNSTFPIIFQATHGVTGREADSPSSYNALEAEVLCWYVKSLLTQGLGGGVGVQPSDIGVVAPYAAQCKLISEKLRRKGYSTVEVGSVETYQGREKPIIIVTLVRSFASLGFMRSPRRVNVLLSRAKSLLILIGNPVTLRHHRDINFIIDECKLRGNYLFKKKNGLQRPQFLKDVEEQLSEKDEFDDELTMWYAKMPKHISVALPNSTPDESSNIPDQSSSSTSSSISPCCTPARETLNSKMSNLMLCNCRSSSPPSRRFTSMNNLLQLQ
ncbi:putative helicase mov-10-B.2 isoform X2 [Drosophila grimshawi]|uniref:putative helicase mov-10-B.2 isoform X2 n=1 Tax=Drosophila grimshawi TaxID=7222 RepID=UPI001C936BF8|nr:putative helicase mov-10-B.2 isoform X2 [Drosophila grimshawi]